MIKLGTKCGFALDQLECSLSKGLSYLEFHTYIEDLEGKIDFAKVKKLLDDKSVKCMAIHAPISDYNNNKHTITIGTLYDDSRKSNIELFKKCIALADYLCETDTPIVVLHAGTGFDSQDKQVNDLSDEQVNSAVEKGIEDLCEINEFLKTNYPHVVCVVENMTSLCYHSDLSFSNWYKLYREDLPSEIAKANLSNIKTCLDICHLTSTMRLDKLFNLNKDKGLEYYMNCYSDTLGLFHLNNCINFGEQAPANHSRPFILGVKEDEEMLEKFFKTYMHLNLSCPITLEIQEEDFLTQNNITETIKTIIKVTDKLNIPFENNFNEES